jgi:hypothetical protein
MVVAAEAAFTEAAGVGSTEAADSMVAEAAKELLR